MSTNDLILYLQQLITETGTQKELAARLGVSLPYLNDVLHGRREPGEKILSALGYERVVTYRKTTQLPPA